jgi:hypothetical protein
MKALNLWLELSKNTALSVRIRHDHPLRTPEFRSMDILAALIPHAHRWKDVHIHVPSSTIASLTDLSLGGLPSLRNLTLDVKGWRHASVSLDVQALKIPWSQLTGLILNLDSDHLLTLNQCAGILSQCVRLTWCIINADYAFSRRGATQRKLAIPALTHFDLTIQRKDQLISDGLRITDAPEACSVAFLEQLELPRLRSLSLRWLIKQDGSDEQWSEVHSRFISTLSSMALTLRCLSMSYLPLSDGQVLDCLSQLHGLSRLDLRFSLADGDQDPITDTFLHACTLQHDEWHPGFLPLLQSVYLQCHGGRHSAAQIMHLIQSRWTPIRNDVHLESFSLVSRKPISTRMRQQLEQWEGEGLDVSIDQFVVR